MKDSDFQALRKEYSYEDFDDLMMHLVVNYVYCGEPSKEEAKMLTKQIKKRIADRLDEELKKF